MNYPYAIPGTGAAPLPDNYFYVGNECCGSCVSKDFAATVKVYFDYTSELPSGVNVSSVTYSITPAIDQMIVLSNKTLNANIASFLIGDGVTGQRYVIEATAQLSDGQVWIDSISVSVVACIVTPTTAWLAPLGPVQISETLYYLATAEQTIFPLSTPDQFNQTSMLVDSNVLVYAGGDRQVPVDDYTLNVAANEIIFLQPLTVGEEVVFDLVTVPPPIPPPIQLNSAIIATTLYYIATAGQTVFYLATPDEFNNIASIGNNSLLVFLNGTRLVHTDSYTVDVPNNRVILSYPAGVGESVIFDLVAPAPAPLPPPTVPGTIKMEALAITVANFIPNLTYVPDGNMLVLFVNGTAFFPIGPDKAFTYTGKTLAWTSTVYSLPVGATVIAVYTHA
jgi:hypothetical protein